MAKITINYKYGNVPVVAMVGGNRVAFKSKLEYRWAQHLEFLKQADVIKDWFYEFHTFRDFPAEQRIKEYTPDFLVRLNDNTFEYHETKGLLSGFDIKKFKLILMERPYVKLILIFWGRPKISAHRKGQLERFCHRVIYNAKSMLKNEPIDMS